MKSNRGFSLLELLIVVAIILIIATIAIPSLLKSRQAANEASAATSLRVVNTAEVSYMSTWRPLRLGHRFGDCRFARQPLFDSHVGICCQHHTLCQRTGLHVLCYSHRSQRRQIRFLQQTRLCDSLQHGSVTCSYRTYG